jgi:hypothetical protein
VQTHGHIPHVAHAIEAGAGGGAEAGAGVGTGADSSDEEGGTKGRGAGGHVEHGRGVQTGGAEIGGTPAPDVPRGPKTGGRGGGTGCVPEGGQGGGGTAPPPAPLQTC